MSFWTDHPELRPSTCKSCGKKVLYVTELVGGVAEKIQILDPAPPCYELDLEDPVTCKRTKLALVSHFATCPNASAHSKGGKR